MLQLFKTDNQLFKIDNQIPPCHDLIVMTFDEHAGGTTKFGYRRPEKRQGTDEYCPSGVDRSSRKERAVGSNPTRAARIFFFTRQSGKALSIVCLITHQVGAKPC